LLKFFIFYDRIINNDEPELRTLFDVTDFTWGLIT